MTRFLKSTKTISERRKLIFKYILNSISWDGYDIQEPKTNKDKLLFVLNNFKKENEFEFKKYGYHHTFKNHLQGLPSYINIEFENYKILEFIKTLGYTLLTEKDEDKILNNWWDYMTTSFFMLCKKEKINIYEVLK